MSSLRSLYPIWVSQFKLLKNTLCVRFRIEIFLVSVFPHSEEYLCSMWWNLMYFETRKTSNSTSILVGIPYECTWTEQRQLRIQKNISKHKSSATNEGPDDCTTKKHQELCGLNGGTAVVGKTWFWKMNVWMCWKTQRKISRTLTYWIQANLIISQKPGR